MVIRGLRNLRRCAWIGEEDSAEQDEDDKSNESGRQPIVNVHSTLQETHGSDLSNNIRKNMTASQRQELIDLYLDKISNIAQQEVSSRVAN